MTGTGQPESNNVSASDAAGSIFTAIYTILELSD
jgi:hypothetical protein